MRRFPTSGLIPVGLCVNDPRNGMFTGRCREIDMGMSAEVLRLESPWFDKSLKCWVDGRVLTLGKGMVFAFDRYQEGVGNWCWDQAWFTPDRAAALVNFAIGKGYRPTVGECVLWDKIDRGEELTTADLLEAMR